MAIMEAVFRGLFAGQETINRVHYICGGTPAAVSRSFALVFALGAIKTGVPEEFPPTGLFARWAAAISTGFTFLEIEARDMYSAVDFYTRPFPAPTTGVLTGESLSPVMAVGIRSNRVTTLVRRGYKRFAGIPESLVGTEGALTEAALTAWSDVAAAFSEVLSYDDEGNTLTFTPAVLSFEEYVTPKGNRAYKPYATEAAQLTHSASGILYEPYDRIRSQVSRQFGRGR